MSKPAVRSRSPRKNPRNGNGEREWRRNRRGVLKDLLHLVASLEASIAEFLDPKKKGSFASELFGPNYLFDTIVGKSKMLHEDARKAWAGSIEPDSEYLYVLKNIAEAVHLSAIREGLVHRHSLIGLANAKAFLTERLRLRLTNLE
jgi:hypothetical protein